MVRLKFALPIPLATRVARMFSTIMGYQFGSVVCVDVHIPAADASVENTVALPSMVGTMGLRYFAQSAVSRTGWYAGLKVPVLSYPTGSPNTCVIELRNVFSVTFAKRLSILQV
jgi:hypothetical protein